MGKLELSQVNLFYFQTLSESPLLFNLESIQFLEFIWILCTGIKYYFLLISDYFNFMKCLDFFVF